LQYAPEKRFAVMDQPFSPVEEVTAFDQLLERSQDGPVVLFKHDLSCPISAAAHRELAQLDAPVYLIDVGRQDLSQAVAERTGVEHESPQVIVARNGEAVWDASHYDITVDAVEQATREHA
jgi:bacillithiol system protein YtxJ